MFSHLRFRPRVLGILVAAGTVTAVAVAGWVVPRQRAEMHLEQVRAEWRDLVGAMNAYAVDRCGIYLPPDTSWRRGAGFDHPLTFENDPDYIAKGSGAEESGPQDFHDPLTTPIGYYKGSFADPFRRGGQYGYAIAATEGPRGYPWLGFLHSPGPDRVEQVTPEALREEIRGHLDPEWGPNELTNRKRIAMREAVRAHLYDPTNGTLSAGDLILVLEVQSPAVGYPVFGSEMWADLKPEPVLPESSSGAHDTRQSYEPNVSVPSWLPKVLMALQIDLGDGDSVMDSPLIQAVSNRLGMELPGLFADPPEWENITPESIARVTDEPELWWRAVRAGPQQARNAQSESLPVSREALATVLPLFGKSIVIVALGENDVTGLEQLESLLDGYESNLPSPTAHERRIVGELRRLCAVAREHVSSRSGKSSDSFLRGHSDKQLRSFRSSSQILNIQNEEYEILKDPRESRMSKNGNMEFRSEVMKYQRPTRQLIAKPGDPGCLPVTKIGGIPWWPEGLERPTCAEGHKMAFVVQIRLSDVPGFESHTSTLVSFHYCLECTIEGSMSFGWEDEEEESGGYSVSVLTEINRKQPDGLGIVAKDEIVEAHSVSFRNVEEIPCTEDIEEMLEEDSIPDDFPDLDSDMDEDLYPGLKHVALTKVGGWPTWVQSPDLPDILSEGEKLHFLAQLDMDLFWESPWCNGYAYLYLIEGADGELRGEMGIQTT